jgi:hypothetical protein
VTCCGQTRAAIRSASFPTTLVLVCSTDQRPTRGTCLRFIQHGMAESMVSTPCKTPFAYKTAPTQDQLVEHLFLVLQRLKQLYGWQEGRHPRCMRLNGMHAGFDPSKVNHELCRMPLNGLKACDWIARMQASTQRNRRVIKHHPRATSMLLQTEHTVPPNDQQSAFTQYPSSSSSSTSGAINSCVPSVFGRNLQCQQVRGVNFREECH